MLGEGRELRAGLAGDSQGPCGLPVLVTPEVKNIKQFVPVARGPAGIGCRIPMAPFGKVPLPMVGMRGVMPAMGARGASPAVGTVIGVNMARFVPGIMDMLGTVTKPETQIHKYTVTVKPQYSSYSTG